MRKYLLHLQWLSAVIAQVWGQLVGSTGDRCVRHYPGFSIRGAVEYRRVPIRNGLQCISACRRELPTCKAALHLARGGGSQHQCALYTGNLNNFRRYAPVTNIGESYTLYEIPAFCAMFHKRARLGVVPSLVAVPLVPSPPLLGPFVRPSLKLPPPVSLAQLVSTGLAPQFPPRTIPAAPSTKTGWVEWGPWGSCSRSCGLGLRSRSRDCFNCPGPYQDSGVCNEEPCPVWANWGSWATCSVSCGGGTRNRVRHCDGGSVGAGTCLGQYEETTACDEPACPLWSAWGEFGTCSASCGVGVQVKTRICRNGATTCPGPSTEARSCAGTNCPSWLQWSPYGACSVTCGAGIRARTRSCSLPNSCGEGASFESQPCAEGLCSAWTEWDAWELCSATCGEGLQSRRRACEGGGSCFGGPGSESRRCSPGVCPYWTGWTAWNSCSASCGDGTQVRARVCSHGSLCNAAEPAAAETRSCRGTDCPTDAALQRRLPSTEDWEPTPFPWPDTEEHFSHCSHGQWSQWGSCSVSCGSGVSIRVRPCSCPVCPLKAGSSADHRSCSSPCPHVDLPKTYLDPQHQSFYLNRNQQ